MNFCLTVFLEWLSNVRISLLLSLGVKRIQTIENSLWNCCSKSMECRNHVLSPGFQIPNLLTYFTAFSYFWCFNFRSLCLQLLLFVIKGNNHNSLLLIPSFAYWGSFSLFCFVCNLSYSAVLKFTTLLDFWCKDTLLLLGALALHPSLSAILFNTLLSPLSLLLCYSALSSCLCKYNLWLHFVLNPGHSFCLWNKNPSYLSLLIFDHLKFCGFCLSTSVVLFLLANCHETALFCFEDSYHLCLES